MEIREQNNTFSCLIHPLPTKARMSYPAIWIIMLAYNNRSYLDTLRKLQCLGLQSKFSGLHKQVS